MIKIALIEDGMTAGSGSNVYSYCIEVPMIFGGSENGQPQVNVAFSLNGPFTNGTYSVIPCIATISLKYVNCQGVVTKQQEMKEYFTLGAAVSTVPQSISLANQGGQTTYTHTKCCKSYGLRVDGTLTLTTVAS